MKDHGVLARRRDVVAAGNGMKASTEEVMEGTPARRELGRYGQRRSFTGGTTDSEDLQLTTTREPGSGVETSLGSY